MLVSVAPASGRSQAIPRRRLGARAATVRKAAPDRVPPRAPRGAQGPCIHASEDRVPCPCTEAERNRNFSSTGRIVRVLDLFPDTARIDDGALSLGGIAATELVRAHGSPLVVYDEATLRAQARAYRAAAPDALRLLRHEGVPERGAPAPPRRGRHRRRRLDARASCASRSKQASPATALVVHGNNKSDDELRAAAAAGALVVIDSLEEIDRARAAGVTRTLIRVTPGIEADTHETIRTGHHGSKFGLPPDDALEGAPPRPRDRRPPRPHRLAAPRSRRRTAAPSTGSRPSPPARATKLGWTLRTIDFGGGLGVASTPDDPELSIAEFVGGLLAELEKTRVEHGLAQPQVILEPGRSLTARAGVTLYTVGSVKQSGAETTYVAVDGGMSDNPRPALYGARYTALLANRADEPPTAPYTVVGKHCESGDMLIERVELPEPHRGDILAVPTTGAYTLAMSSTYNAVPRPAAVLVEGRRSARDPPARDDRRPARARDLVHPPLGLVRSASGADRGDWLRRIGQDNALQSTRD